MPLLWLLYYRGRIWVVYKLGAGLANKSIPLQNNNYAISHIKVKIEHGSKQKTCEFFAMPRNGQALLGMSALETLDVLTINCNKIDTQTKWTNLQ